MLMTNIWHVKRVAMNSKWTSSSLRVKSADVQSSIVAAMPKARTAADYCVGVGRSWAGNCAGRLSLMAHSRFAGVCVCEWLLVGLPGPSRCVVRVW